MICYYFSFVIRISRRLSRDISWILSSETRVKLIFLAGLCPSKVKSLFFPVPLFLRVLFLLHVFCHVFVFLSFVTSLLSYPLSFLVMFCNFFTVFFFVILIFKYFPLCEQMFRSLSRRRSPQKHALKIWGHRRNRENSLMKNAAHLSRHLTAWTRESSKLLDESEFL